MPRIVLAGFVLALAACAALGVWLTEALDAEEPTGVVPQALAAPISRCINMGNALEASTEGEWGYRIRSQDLEEISRVGFDAIRVPVKWSAHAGTAPPYTIDPALFERVDEVIGQALDLGLWVVLDVHHYNELMLDPERHTPRLEAIWAQIADHYADWPDGLMFELLNEPNGPLMTEARVEVMFQRILSQIRARQPDRWVVYGGAGWGGLDSLLKMAPPDDPRLMTTFHYYDPYEFTHQGASWADNPPPLGATWGTARERTRLLRHMDSAARYSQQTGHPIFLGEFGAIGIADLAERAEWSSAVRSAAEARGISWCHWDWVAGFPVYDLEREAWIPEMKAALLPEAAD